MPGFLGEYECKLDAKSRFILPSGLKKQVPEEAGNQFVINRGFERCLILYPKNEWEKIAREVENLNDYDKEKRRFMRYFFRGATPLALDASDRLRIPQQLQKHAHIEQELMLFAYSNKIEIWDRATYEQMMDEEPEDFAQLAEKILGSASEEAKSF